MRQITHNLCYLIKHLWRTQRSLFWMTLALVPMQILPAYIGLYIPKVILDQSEQGATVNALLGNLLPLLALILVNKIILDVLYESMGLGKIIHRLRYINKLSEKAMTTDYANMDSASGQKKYQNALMNTNHNDAATEKFVLVTQSFFTNALGLILYSSLVFLLNPWILLFLLVASLTHFVLGHYKNAAIDARHEERSAIGRKLGYITKTSSSFEMMKDIKLYQMKEWFDVNYGEWLERLMAIDKKNGAVKWAVEAADGLLLVIRDGLAYGYLIYAVLNGGLSLGDFAFYFGAVTGLSVWLFGVVKNITDFDDISRNVAHLRTFLELKDFKGPNEAMASAEPIEAHLSSPCEITLENVSFRYEGALEDTIKNLSLTIQKGEKIALVGANGAGKTTLVKLLTGLYHPTSGKILINGKAATAFDRDDYFKLFSVVFQDAFVIPMCIEENLTMKTSQELTDIERQRLMDILKDVGLSDKIGALPNGLKTRLVKSVFEDAVALSGGEMQKLMMAQALYKAGPILILDEPTAALDPIAEKLVYQKYHEMTDHCTSVFISHRLASTRFCDRILFLSQGVIAEEGTHDSLMAKETAYRDMFEKQSHYYQEEVAS